MWYRPLALGLAISLMAAVSSTAAAAPPANDDFANAAVLGGFPVSAEGTNAEATNEPGDPAWPFQDRKMVPYSVWFRWTAPSSRHVAVFTCSNDRPWPVTSNVSIGENLSTLRVIGSTSGVRPRPDCPSGYGIRVAFFAVAGQSYNILVGGIETGGFRLRIVPAGSVRMELVPVPPGLRARLVYRAGRGELNRIAMSLDWDPAEDGYSFRRPAVPYPPVSFHVGTADGDAVSAGAACAIRVFAFGFTDCPIPDGLLATGPQIRLGDGDDWARVEFSRGGTVVVGGSGDDEIFAGGRISGGPGDDVIFARSWVSSWIRGGPGDDRIKGSKRRDVIDPGPGIDSVDGRGVAARNLGGEVVNTRDGEIDYPRCSATDTAYIDAFDEYPQVCGTVHRRGAPRAIPADVAPITAFHDNGSGSVRLSCPADGPDVCAGSFTVRRAARVFAHRRFALERDFSRYNGEMAFSFPASNRQIRAMEGELRITVRTRGHDGKLRTASGVYELNAD